MKSLKFFFFNFLKLAGLWLVGEVVAIYGSKVAEGFSAFQRRSCVKIQLQWASYLTPALAAIFSGYAAPIILDSCQGWRSSPRGWLPSDHALLNGCPFLPTDCLRNYQTLLTLLPLMNAITVNPLSSWPYNLCRPFWLGSWCEHHLRRKGRTVE